MPTLAAALKLEIRRLAAKEIRRVVRPVGRVKKAMKALRLAQREQGRVLTGIERRLLRLRSRTLGGAQGSSAGGRLSAESIRSLRARLGMTRKQFAALLGVSPGSIFGWETGRTVPRGASRDRLAEIRKKGVRAVRSQAAAARPAGRRRRGAATAGGRGRRRQTTPEAA